MFISKKEAVLLNKRKKYIFYFLHIFPLSVSGGQGGKCTFRITRLTSGEELLN